jgi:hypothetical protein
LGLDDFMAAVSAEFVSLFDCLTTLGAEFDLAVYQHWFFGCCRNWRWGGSLLWGGGCCWMWLALAQTSYGGFDFIVYPAGRGCFGRSWNIIQPFENFGRFGDQLPPLLLVLLFWQGSGFIVEFDNLNLGQDGLFLGQKLLAQALPSPISGVGKEKRPCQEKADQDEYRCPK